MHLIATDNHSNTKAPFAPQNINHKTLTKNHINRNAQLCAAIIAEPHDCILSLSRYCILCTSFFKSSHASSDPFLAARCSHKSAELPSVRHPSPRRTHLDKSYCEFASPFKAPIRYQKNDFSCDFSTYSPREYIKPRKQAAE